MCASASRTDEPRKSQGFNQSPNPLSADLTTNQDLDGIVNQRENRSGSGGTGISAQLRQDGVGDDGGGLPRPERDRPPGGDMIKTPSSTVSSPPNPQPSQPPSTNQVEAPSPGSVKQAKSRLGRIKHALITFGQFVGPGVMISVAYSECVTLTYHG